MKKYINKIKIYGVTASIRMFLYIIRTKLIFRNAKLIRFPFDIRGKHYMKIDDGFTAGFGCRIEAYPDCYRQTVLFIGKNVQINDYVHITAVNSVIIGDNVLIASKVYISDSTHGCYSGEHQSSPSSIVKDRKLTFKPVCIKNNVWIGENVAILPGVTVGENSIIGANSVVTKNIPDNCIAIGNPARVSKIYNRTIKQWRKVTIDK